MAKKEKKETKQKSSYFKEMKAELKKVVWPTPKELANNTVAVIAFVFIIALIVFICDFCFDNKNARKGTIIIPNNKRFRKQYFRRTK